jgi:hypothetical protein
MRFSLILVSLAPFILDSPSLPRLKMASVRGLLRDYLPRNTTAAVIYCKMVPSAV